MCSIPTAESIVINKREAISASKRADIALGCRMATHELKTWPEYFAKIASGEKTFELRKNDRDYRVGDTLILREYDPHYPTDLRYKGGWLKRLVTYICKGGAFGLPDDMCIMSIAPIPIQAPAPPPALLTDLTKAIEGVLDKHLPIQAPVVHIPAQSEADQSNRVLKGVTITTPDGFYGACFENPPASQSNCHCAGLGLGAGGHDWP